MNPGATTLREASMRLPVKHLNWFLGATWVIQPFSIRTEWLGKTAAAFPPVSTVPFSMRSDIVKGIAWSPGLVLQRGQFSGSARAHGDGARKALLSAERTPNAERGIKGWNLLPVQSDGLVGAARAIAAMLAEFRHDLRQFLGGREGHEIGDRIGQSRANEFFDRLEAPFFHQEAQSGMELIYNAEAVFHHNGTELDGLRSQGQEVGSGLVVHRTAVARHRDARARYLGQRKVADGQDAFTGHAYHHAFFPAPVIRDRSAAFRLQNRTHSSKF